MWEFSKELSLVRVDVERALAFKDGNKILLSIRKNKKRGKNPRYQ